MVDCGKDGDNAINQLGLIISCFVLFNKSQVNSRATYYIYIREELC